MKKRIILIATLAMVTLLVTAQNQRRPMKRDPFKTDTMMVHDPVMAYEDGTYYIYATGMGIQTATSQDRKTWTVYPEGLIKDIPEWTHDSVPGFERHIWAPDIIRWHGKWWLTYSCSTFGKNGSAIGLMSNTTLRPDAPDYHWEDLGCLICSKENRDNWNAIDPNIVIDDNDQAWIMWGSFWDGIQMAPLQESGNTLKLGSKPKTVARRHVPGSPSAEPNPTSQYAGKNAIEAPFVMKHGGYYYLFVSWDYCCRGSKSNYRVAVGRSKNVAGPYLDKSGINMLYGGGDIIAEGDKKEYEAMGHCSAYTMNGEDLFLCHGYSVEKGGASLLVERKIRWTPYGWPVLERPSAAQGQGNYETDVFKTKSGKTVKFHALMHASIRVEYDGKDIEIDPCAKLGNRTVDYSLMPKADYIFVTHEHGDHYDAKTIGLLSCERTQLIMNQRCADMYGSGKAMKNGDKIKIAKDITVEAVPAYNTTEGRQQFHPQGRDNGYILTIDGLRIYIAGDTEDIPEMATIKDIDIAFLPCNQPFTMTPEQLVRAAKAIKPKVLFPYHYGQTDVSTIPSLLKKDGIDVRIRHYE